MRQEMLDEIASVYQSLSGLLIKAAKYKNGLSIWEYGHDLQAQYQKLQDEKEAAEKELRQAKKMQNKAIQEFQVADDVSAIRFAKRTTGRRKS